MMTVLCDNKKKEAKYTTAAAAFTAANERRALVVVVLLSWELVSRVIGQNKWPLQKLQRPPCFTLINVASKDDSNREMHWTRSATTRREVVEQQRSIGGQPADEQHGEKTNDLADPIQSAVSNGRCFYLCSAVPPILSNIFFFLLFSLLTTMVRKWHRWGRQQMSFLPLFRKSIA